MEKNYLVSCLIVILFVLFTEINGSGKSPMLIRPYDLLPEETTTETTPITTEESQRPFEESQQPL
ncbi:unnamed protein product [Schistosoma rodhaini]|nr:unnamed protein product [Schistosoma rodhaini]